VDHDVQGEAGAVDRLPEPARLVQLLDGGLAAPDLLDELARPPDTALWYDALLATDGQSIIWLAPEYAPGKKL